MALKRLQRDEVYRFYLASPLAFADWENPTTAELNANPTNDPNGLIFNLSCALDTDTSQFDLDELMPAAFLVFFAVMLFKAAAGARNPRRPPLAKLPPLKTSAYRKDGSA